MKTVIITGATSGYGLATAQKFKENGYRVIVASRNEEKVRKIVSEYGFDDGFKIDVSNFSEWLSLKNYVAEKYGRIDVLVNNAGGGIAIEEITEQTPENIDKAISLNLNSVIYGSKLFGQMMKENGSGIIINIASVCARHSWKGWGVYAAAKAGVLNFTKSLYVELRPFGVRATCVIPAAAATGFSESAGTETVEQSLKAEHIADAVYYAASQPEGVVVEEMTVWGTSQEVHPL